MADIFLESIAHSYAARPGPGDYVLHDVELHWRHGGAYALLGPSGCGKTTLLNIMSGLIQPTRGRVRYGERDVTALPTRQRNIAQVFQFPVIYDTMTVFDNLAFPLRNRGLGPAEVKKRVEHIAGMLELDAVLGRRATGLTADTKQIISLGRGLVRDDVAAILFDEPLTVIDPHTKWKLRRKLREIHRQFEHTLIYVTHDQTEALTFADEVVVMHQGRVLQQGTPEDLFASPVHTHVGYFIGSPGMNFLPCRVEDGAAIVGEHRVRLPDALARAAATRTGTVVLGIRPEHLRIVPGPAGDSAAGVAGHVDGAGALVPLAVERVDDLGRNRLVTGSIGAHRVKIETAEETGSAASAGATCLVHLPPEHIRLYEDDRLIASLDPGAPGAPSA